MVVIQWLLSNGCYLMVVIKWLLYKLDKNMQGKHQSEQMQANTTQSERVTQQIIVDELKKHKIQNQQEKVFQEQSISIEIKLKSSTLNQLNDRTSQKKALQLKQQFNKLSLTSNFILNICCFLSMLVQNYKIQTLISRKTQKYQSNIIFVIIFVYFIGNASCTPCTDIHCSLCSTNCTNCAVGYTLTTTACICSMPNCNTCDVNSSVCQSCTGGYVVDLSSQCSLCNVAYPNCTSCLTSSCSACVSSYYLSTYCNSCNSAMPSCSTCSSALICTLCASNYVLLSTTPNTCQLCQTAMPSCSTCTSALICAQCTSNYVLLSTTPNTCQLCQTAMPSCSTCTSALICAQCMSSYFLLPTTPNTCQLCQNAMVNCSTCSSASICTQCISNYVIVPSTPNACQLCQTAIVNCSSCTNVSVCGSCQTTYGLNNVGGGVINCQLCNLTDIYCLYCSTYNTCTQCINNNYYVNGSNACHSCSIISNCLNCTNGPTCINCLNDLYYLAANNTCVLCTTLTGCTNCTSNITCTNCINTTYYLASNNSCILCSTLNSCTLCLNNVTCISCTSTYYTIALNNSCILCNVTLSFCNQCSNRTYCLQCDNNTYYLNATSHTCFYCNTFLLECKTCDNYYRCTSCLDDTYYLDVNLHICKTCDQRFPYCYRCNGAIRCKICDQSLYLNSAGQCVCLRGRVVTGICIDDQLCNIAVKNITSGGATCISCPDDSYVTPNGTCICYEGWVVTHICTTIYGCVSMVKYSVNGTAQKRCLTCNLTQHFYVLSGICACQAYFQYNQTINSCSQICGDGRLFVLACDDNNTISGDGCSSNCLIQDNFRCANGTISSPTTCIYYGNFFQMKLTGIHKIYGQNDCFFLFEIQPALITLSKMNFISYFNLTGNPHLTIKNITQSNGLVQANINFLQNLQGLPASLTLSYDPSLFTSAPSTLHFNMVSDDYQLILTNHQEVIFSEKMKKVFIALSILALVLLFISLPFHKMIGVQTLLTFQIIFFSQLAMSDFSETLNCLSGLDYSNGYGKQIYYDPNVALTLGTFFLKLNQNKQFLENSLLIFIIQAISFTIFVVFLMYLKCKKQLQQYENRYSKSWLLERHDKSQFELENRPKIFKYIEVYYSSYVFPLIIGFMLMTFLSMLANQKRIYETTFVNTQNEITTSFNNSSIYLNGIVVLVSFWLLGLVFWFEIVMCFNVKAPLLQMHGMKGVKQFYIGVYLLYLSIFSILLFYMYNLKSKYVIYPISAIVLMYTIWIMVYRPYQEKIHNFSIIFNQFTVLLFVGSLLFREIMFTLNKDVSSTIQFVIVYFLVGLLSLVNIFSIIRLTYQIRKTWISYKQSKHNLKQIIKDQENFLKKGLNQKNIDLQNVRYEIQKEQNTKGNDMAIDKKSNFVFEEKIKKSNEMQILKKKLKESLLKYRNTDTVE